MIPHLPDISQLPPAVAVTVAPVGPDGQHEAVMRLVRAYFGDEAVVEHSDEGAPSVTGRMEQVSISHCRTMAALAVSAASGNVGVDIEEPREQLRRVAPRYLTADELTAYGADGIDGLLLAWTMKEAVYKAALTVGLALHDIKLPLEAGDNSARVGCRQFDLYASVTGLCRITVALEREL